MNDIPNLLSKAAEIMQGGVQPGPVMGSGEHPEDADLWNLPHPDSAQPHPLTGISIHIGGLYHGLTPDNAARVKKMKDQEMAQKRVATQRLERD